MSRVAIRRTLAALAWGGALVVSVGLGCGGLKYPSCESDEDCTADGHTGVCVAGKCVECRDDAACGTGKSCDEGKCVAIPGYCDDSKACEQGSTCGKDHRCKKVVASVAPKECDDDNPCADPKQHCQNGHCVSPPNGGPGCTDFPAPTFSFESPEVQGQAKKTLDRLVGCLNKSLKGAHVLLVGHCDARGEYEFNMGLGAQRAEGVKGYLTTAGIPADIIATSSRGKLDATGTDEAGWQHDRRVDIEIR